MIQLKRKQHFLKSRWKEDLYWQIRPMIPLTFAHSLRIQEAITAFRRIATRYEKLAKRFLAIVQIGCIMIWLA